jgi:Transcription factor WhiB
MTPEQFFAAIAAIPRLPGAKCKGKAPAFDLETRDPAQEAVALALCRSCPALVACRQWAATVDPRTLFGVIAGHRYTDPTIRKKVTPPCRSTTEKDCAI